MITFVVFSLALALAITCLILSAILFVDALGVFINRAARGVEVYRHAIKERNAEKNEWRIRLLRGE